MFYKPEIREKLLTRRRHLDTVSKVQAAQAVAAQVVQLDCFLDSQHIGCYFSDGDELDPTPILHVAERLNKKLYLPILRHHPNQPPQPLEFYSYQTSDELCVNRLKIREPNPETQIQIDPRALDIIIMPLVAFDEWGNRLGRGAGHYDRTLAFLHENPPSKRPRLIGLAYEFQKVEKIEPSHWDIPLDMIVTEKNLYVSR